MENEREHALKTPVPGILPSITSPEYVDHGSAAKKKAKKEAHPWYYLGLD